MELKCFSTPALRLTLMCSNRTFMELKFEGCINYQDVMDGSNRTFMELK